MLPHLSDRGFYYKLAAIQKWILQNIISEKNSYGKLWG